MSNELLTCPWCGEQMRFDADSVHVWYKCDNCLATSPKARRLWDDSKTNQENWNENKNRALFLIERSNAKSSRWIPFEERLPPMGEVLISHCGHVCIAWHHGQGKFETGSRMMLVVGKHDITHWMPLPEPPEEVQK